MDPAVTITARRFSLGSLQATIWTPDEEVSGQKLMAGLYPSLAPRFDGEPFIYPSPEGLPRQVPRIILGSACKRWRCEIASERLNLFWRRQEPEDEIPLAGFVEVASRVIQQYVEFLRARVGRAAFLRTAFVETDGAALFLARHFCSERWTSAPFNRPDGFEVHAHKRFQLGERWTVNSWVRNKSGRVTVSGSTQPALVVEQDLNTLAEEAATRKLSPADVDDFLSAASNECDTILDLYYPAE